MGTRADATPHPAAHALTQPTGGYTEFVPDPARSRRPNPDGNLLVRGENLAVLTSLQRAYTGAVKCYYIDPPYNNQERHYHYADSQDHRLWVDELTARVAVIGRLLREDGSLWVSIDDREMHYLKVACDAVLGRSNFVTTIFWQQRTTRENRRVFSNNHEYLLVYARDAKAFAAARNRLPLSSEARGRYRNPDADPRGAWQSVSANAQAGHATPDQFYRLVAPCGKVHVPPHGRCWVYTLRRMEQEIRANNIWFGRDGNAVPRIKRFLSHAAGLTPATLWTADEVGTNDAAKKQLLRLFPNDEVFDTPKPEGLIYRLLEIATKPGELVLDAYLGSGTTAAVAHKSGRPYIGIEQGVFVADLAARRLAAVCDGDETGVSPVVGWTGGGGFDVYRHQPARLRPGP